MDRVKEGKKVYVKDLNGNELRHDEMDIRVGT